MTQFGKNLFFLVAVAVVSCLALPAFAQAPGDIRVTTNAEVAVPGQLLPPGTYRFLRAVSDNPSMFKIVNDDGRVITFVQVIPTQRGNERNDTEVDVSAPDASGVRTLQAWYSAGDSRGFALVYSKEDRQKLDQVAEMRAHSGYSGGQN